MFNKQFSLSTDDFESGRYTKVARFIIKTWPRIEPISLSKAQQVLAVTLGYADYHDAQNSATATSPADPTHWPSGLEQRLDQFLQMGWETCNSTVEAWPLHMLGRWNMAGLPCIFGSKAIAKALEIFVEYFASDKTVVDRFQVKRTPCALSLLATELRRLSYAELQKPLGSLITGVARQLVFDRAVEFLFEEFTSECLELISAHSGMSPRDFWNLPKNESSFPDLFAALDGIYGSWLREPAINRFIKARLPSGFYNDDPDPGRGREAKPSIIAFPNHRVEVHLNRIWLDESPFKAYGWKARSLDQEGLALVEAEGGFVVGPKGDASSADLIEATELCGVAGVYAYLQSLIADLEMDGEDVQGLTPANLNTAIIFELGNLLVIDYLERNERAAPGAGIELIAAVIKDLKRRFKRDLNVCGVIDPYQYHRAARQITSLEERRVADAQIVHLNFQYLYSLDAVADMHFEPETDTRIPCEFYYEAVTSPLEPLDD